ncbi:helicase-associated domain-containing protein [Singulisphaera rosea]
MRSRAIERVRLEESYQRLSLDHLVPLGPLLVSQPPTRKRDLVPFLTAEMSRPDRVRQVYEGLEDINKAAIQEAVHDHHGRLDLPRFEAKYGRPPRFGAPRHPSPLSLLMPDRSSVPVELLEMLKTFVPEPREVTLTAVEQPPEAVRLSRPRKKTHPDQEPESIPIRRRSTEPVARKELGTILRLVESGKLRASAKTRRPAKASVEIIRGFLVKGDFYDAADQSEDESDPGFDLAIRAYAWPLILQVAGLASLSGSKLELSAEGRKALGQRPEVVLRSAWKKWCSTTLFDELQRFELLKGQSKARPTAPNTRRRVLVDALEECPPGLWIEPDEFFRFIRATGQELEVVNNEWMLCFVEPDYNRLAFNDPIKWEQLQGRYILTFLFEVAATLGILDVAFIPPQLARGDFRGLWSLDHCECMSRYDGLKYFRINGLGAWCLGLTREYEPEVERIEPNLQVLPNLDIVLVGQDPDPADLLVLDRYAERTSDSVWRLERLKILAAVEGGFDLDEFTTFLAARSRDPLPQTVNVFLEDTKARAGQLRDLGTARMIECSSPETALLLVHDRDLSKRCQLAGDRRLVFSIADEAAVRARLRKLGYVLPFGG